MSIVNVLILLLKEAKSNPASLFNDLCPSRREKSQLQGNWFVVWDIIHNGRYSHATISRLECDCLPKLSKCWTWIICGDTLDPFPWQITTSPSTMIWLNSRVFKQSGRLIGGQNGNYIPSTFSTWSYHKEFSDFHLTGTVNKTPNFQVE